MLAKSFISLTPSRISCIIITPATQIINLHL
nr:MAG TPA: hypothetical protein [Bacteriophage sp.]